MGFNQLNADNFRGSGIPIVSSLSNVSSPTDGDVVGWEKSTTGILSDESDLSVWWYDGSISRWRCASTFRSWWILEDWSSGSFGSNWNLEDAQPSTLNVDGANNRVEIDFNASPGDMTFRAWYGPAVDFSAELICEARVSGSQPSSGDYSERIGFGKCDDIDLGSGNLDDRALTGVNMNPFGDVVETKLWLREDAYGGSDTGNPGPLSFDTDYFFETQIASTPRSPPERNTQDLWVPHGMAKDTNESILQRSNASRTASYNFGHPSIKMEHDNPDVAGTLTIGRIWIRR